MSFPFNLWNEKWIFRACGAILGSRHRAYIVKIPVTKAYIVKSQKRPPHPRGGSTTNFWCVWILTSVTGFWPFSVSKMLFFRRLRRALYYRGIRIKPIMCNTRLWARTIRGIRLKNPLPLEPKSGGVSLESARNLLNCGRFCVLYRA